MQGALALLVLFIVFGVGSSILTNVIGVAYPAFMSFVALESEGEDDDKQWLTYWVVFGCFSIADQFAGIILSFIPFYYVLKVAFLIWMFHPSSVGSVTMYNNFVLPFMKRFESHIEQIEKEIDNQVNKTAQFINKQKESLTKKEE